MFFLLFFPSPKKKKKYIYRVGLRKKKSVFFLSAYIYITEGIDTSPPELRGANLHV